MVNTMRWLTTAQVAHRLGVKPATVYAYVSRGVLHSHRSADRDSRFDSREVEQLALRGRPRQASQSPALDIRVETSVTEIDDHHIRFRGHDALELAQAVTFEQAAELLWSGVHADPGPSWRGAQFNAPADRIGERLRLIAAHAAVGRSGHLDPETVVGEGRRLIATMVDSLPLAGDGRCPRLLLPDGTAVRGTLAGRLWARLTPRRAVPELVHTLNAAMVLLTDHEMAASTLAARVAASTRAGVHGVVAAGMGALSGPLHGGESARTRRVLAQLADTPVSHVVDDALERYGRLPGFGQVLYPRGDPRAVLLLDMLRQAGAAHALQPVEQLIAAAAPRGLPPPNVDLALAALGLAAGMPEDAGEAIFTPARVVGWLAHAMEEYDERALRFRPRAVYVG